MDREWALPRRGIGLLGPALNQSTTANRPPPPPHQACAGQGSQRWLRRLQYRRPHPRVRLALAIMLARVPRPRVLGHACRVAVKVALVCALMAPLAERVAGQNSRLGPRYPAEADCTEWTELHVKDGLAMVGQRGCVNRFAYGNRQWAHSHVREGKRLHTRLTHGQHVSATVVVRSHHHHHHLAYVICVRVCRIR